MGVALAAALRDGLLGSEVQVVDEGNHYTTHDNTSRRVYFLRSADHEMATREGVMILCVKAKYEFIEPKNKLHRHTTPAAPNHNHKAVVRLRRLPFLINRQCELKRNHFLSASHHAGFVLPLSI